MSSDQHSIYIVVQWLQVLSGTAKNPIGMDYMGPKGWMDGEPEWIYAMSYNIALAYILTMLQYIGRQKGKVLENG